MKSWFQNIKQVFRKDTVLSALLVLIILVLAWFQLDISNQWHRPFHYFIHEMPFVYKALSVATLFSIFSIVWAVLGNLLIAELVFSVFVTFVAIANYYVVQFHNAPLSFLELKNAGTAFNVISEYNFTPTTRVLLLVGLLAIQLILIYYQHKRIFNQTVSIKKRSLKRSVALCLCSAAIIFVGYLSPDPIKPDHVIRWNWTTCYPYYGWVVCTAETLQDAFHLVEKPEGYSKEALANITMPDPLPAGQQADIILILNETFSDPKLVCDITTDNDYLENIHSTGNSIQGYSVVPLVGGGTNKTEYELLTGNSLAIISQSSTPFLTLDLHDARSSVSVLNEQSYETTAAHPQGGVNYSRDIAYPLLGFNNIHFDNDFTNLETSRERNFCTDESVYHNLIRWYEEACMPNNTSSTAPPNSYIASLCKITADITRVIHPTIRFIWNTTWGIIQIK